MTSAAAAVLRGAGATIAFSLGAVVGDGVDDDAIPVVVAASTGAGVLLAALMHRGAPTGWERATRVALQAASLFVALALVMPPLASTALPPGLAARFSLPWDALATPLPGQDLHGVVGALVSAVGAVVVGLAMRDLLRGGGTADPLDPPLVLCRTGLYARLRHPMQLGQIGVVAGAALVEGTVGAVVAAGVFALTLTGPIRVLEEASLRARFGGYGDDGSGQTAP